MRSSFDALHDETRPLRLLDEHPRVQHGSDGTFLGAVLVVLAVVVPVLASVAL